MRMRMRNPSSLFCGLVLVALALNQSALMVEANLDPCKQVLASDKDFVDFFLNFEFLCGEIFLKSAVDKGVDDFDPSLANGGPPPLGGQRANLDPVNRRIIEEFGYQQLDIIRNLRKEGEISRPLIDISKQIIAKFADQALGRPLMPPFDPYANPLNYILTVNSITYNVMVGYVGAIPNLNLRKYRELFTGILGVKAGQNTVLRAYLYRRKNDIVVPYNITVAEVVNRASALANQLGKCGVKEEGLEVPRSLGAAGLTESNILAADNNSLSYSRTAQELVRIVYRSGDEKRPGGYFSKGANGKIAKDFMKD